MNIHSLQSNTYLLQTPRQFIHSWIISAPPSNTFQNIKMLIVNFYPYNSSNRKWLKQHCTIDCSLLVNTKRTAWETGHNCNNNRCKFSFFFEKYISTTMLALKNIKIVSPLQEFSMLRIVLKIKNSWFSTHCREYTCTNYIIS